MKTFTDEKFSGYEFRCTSASANTGFKHVCEVYKDNKLIKDCTSVVNWGNRTWEPYQYASVLESRLAEEGYINDFGELESGEVVILMDSWSQVEGEEEREYVEGEGMVKTGNFKKSVYAKLMELAEKRLLKPSVTITLLNVEYVFTDEYDKCWECGTVHNTHYGDLTYVEEEGMLLCDKCINSPDRVEILIEDAKNDFWKALKPTVDQSIIEELGYSLVTDETFSFEQEFWGATYMTEKHAREFVEKYNGFVQIYEVAQFVVPFQIWVPNSELDKAKTEINIRFNL